MERLLTLAHEHQLGVSNNGLGAQKIFHAHILDLNPLRSAPIVALIGEVVYGVPGSDLVCLFIIDVSRIPIWIEDMGCLHSYLQLKYAVKLPDLQKC